MKYEPLRSISYLSGLDEATLEALACVAVRRRYHTGQMICAEGEPCAGLFIVESGRVKIFKPSPGGPDQILHIFGAGEGFNDVAALDGGPNPVSAMALEPTSVLVIDRPSIMDLLGRYPALSAPRRNCSSGSTTPASCYRGQGEGAGIAKRLRVYRQHKRR